MLQSNFSYFNSLQSNSGFSLLSEACAFTQLKIVLYKTFIATSKDET